MDPDLHRQKESIEKGSPSAWQEQEHKVEFERPANIGNIVNFDIFDPGTHRVIETNERYPERRIMAPYSEEVDCTAPIRMENVKDKSVLVTGGTWASLIEY